MRRDPAVREGGRARTIWSGVMLAIIFCAWAIISGVIMLGSMVFTGAGAGDARVPRMSNSVPEGRHRRNLMAESARFPSAVSMVHRPSRDANEFGIPMPG